VIGRKPVPAEYREWNRIWGAPSGHPVSRSLIVEQRLDDPDPLRYGPFGFQPSSMTRRFEYPWAYFTACLSPGLRVLEVGGGLSGFQFVLATEGCRVTNVDPALREDRRWSDGQSGDRHWLSAAGHATLNGLFRTDVRLVLRTIQDSGLPSRSFDRIFCLSVLEHVPIEEAHAMVAAMAELLAPGGLCLLTIDLFLDLKPFGLRDSNFWGSNIDVRRVLEGQPLDMMLGTPTELLGFPEFQAEKVASQLSRYYVGQLIPTISQTIVLHRRPTR
jgi:hypothetical protein